jgi:hypothetical protein
MFFLVVIFWRFFRAITSLFLPDRTPSKCNSTTLDGGRQTPCTGPKLRAKNE